MLSLLNRSITDLIHVSHGLFLYYIKMNVLIVQNMFILL